MFTYSIKKGFENNNADLNDDNLVTVSELQHFITDYVFKATNGQQLPTVRQENIEFDFALF